MEPFQVLKQKKMQKGFEVKKAAHLWIKTPEGLWASDHHPVYLICSF